MIEEKCGWLDFVKFKKRMTEIDEIEKEAKEGAGK